MRIAVFSSRGYDRRFFDAANHDGAHELVYFDVHLDIQSVKLAAGFAGVCVFVSDVINRPVIEALASGGARLLALRSAGFNHVDLQACDENGLTVVRVPAYSPYAVAEHTVALILALNRKIPRAHARVRDGNFSLDGLLGFDIHGRTVGIVGTGRIGSGVARIMAGFGCKLLAFDPHSDPDLLALGVQYVELNELFSQSDIITLHCPLMTATHHLIDAAAIDLMHDDVMLINTSRGALVDTPAIIQALKQKKIGYLGLDVYEEEVHLFFADLSGQIITDDVFARLQTFPNVLITGHQGFFTREALTAIANTTMENISVFERGDLSGNEVKATRKGE